MKIFQIRFNIMKILKFVAAFQIIFFLGCNRVDYNTLLEHQANEFIDSTFLDKNNDAATLLAYKVKKNKDNRRIEFEFDYKYNKTEKIARVSGYFNEKNKIIVTEFEEL